MLVNVHKRRLSYVRFDFISFALLEHCLQPSSVPHVSLAVYTTTGAPDDSMLHLFTSIYAGFMNEAMEETDLGTRYGLYIPRGRRFFGLYSPADCRAVATTAMRRSCWGQDVRPTDRPSTSSSVDKIGCLSAFIWVKNGGKSANSRKSV